MSFFVDEHIHTAASLQTNQRETELRRELEKEVLEHVPDIAKISRLLEVAATEGFRLDVIDQAKACLFKHEAAKRALDFMR